MKKWIKVLGIIYIIFLTLFVVGIRNDLYNILDLNISSTKDLYVEDGKIYDKIKELYSNINNICSQNKDIIIKLGVLNRVCVINSDNINEIKEANKNIDVERIINSSVFVKGIFGMGSGTVVKKTENEMYILTCYHVVEEIVKLNEAGYNLKVTVGYTKENKIDDVGGAVLFGADIIKVDKKYDLALLRTSVVDNNLNVIDLAKEEPQKGDIVYSVGNPLGILRTISKGILANKVMGCFISENVATYGISGGGLYNNKGELIGVPNKIKLYKGGLDCDGKQTFIPESSLGYSINLKVITLFLRGEI